MPRTGHLDWYPWPSAGPCGEGQPGPVPSEVSSDLLCCVVLCCGEGVTVGGVEWDGCGVELVGCGVECVSWSGWGVLWNDGWCVLEVECL